MNLFYLTEVQLLSKGNVLKRVLDIMDETTEFLNRQYKTQWLDLFHNQEWVSKLCYLCDIFEDSTLDKLSAFLEMLVLWGKMLKTGILATFSHLLLILKIGTLLSARIWWIFSRNNEIPVCTGSKSFPS